MKSAGPKSAMIPQDIAEAIKSFFAARNDILLVFVFGSTAAGKATQMSDIDVALLFSATPDAFRLNDLRDELAARLKKEVDIAVLNDASPILKMQVLKNGVLVLKQNAAVYNGFFVDTLNEYDDYYHSVLVHFGYSRPQ